MIHTPTSHWASSDLWNPRCGGSVGMVQTVPELHGNHLFTHVLICMAASFLSSGVFVCCFLSYPGKIWFFLIDTCWEHGNIPHLHLLLPSAEWEHKPVSRFLELSTAQIKESPLAWVTLKHEDLICIPTATMTFPEAFVCTVVTSTTFQGGYRLVKVQTLSGLIVVKETNLSTCKKLW